MVRTLLTTVVVAVAVFDGPVTVTGRIVADDTGEPIVNARVRLVSAAAAPFAVTDANGRFSASAAVGALRLIAIKSGFVRREVEVRDAANPIELRLTRAAVVSGRVVDRAGNPVVGAVVLGEAPPSGSERPRTIARTDTDDRGQFRLAGLAPGKILVEVVTSSAVAQPQEMPGGVTIFSPRQKKTYFPDADAAADADVIALSPGTEQDGVDFVVGSDQTGFGDVVFAGRAMQPAGPAAGATGAIRGRVTTTDGRALSGAQLRLLGRPVPITLRGARTGSDGRFEFNEVPPGSFSLAVSKSGYEPAKRGDTPQSPLGIANALRTIELHDGEAVNGVDVELVRMGTVTGTVSDELGDPLQGARVQLLRVRYERGRRRLAGAGSLGTTDDRGTYRIFAVPSGRYLVTASIGAVAAVDLPGYAGTYYAGTTDVRAAQFVTIDPSQELTGIDVSLRPARTARIAGTIVGANGQPTTQGTLQLRRNAGAGEIAAPPVGALLKADGTFEFPNVTPGEYLIYADHGRPNPAIEGEFSTTPVTVADADVTGLTIHMPAGSTIAGHITFDSADRDHLPPLSAIQISPVPVDADLAPSNVADADIRADGTFVMHGITGVRRLLTTHVPPGWGMREVRVNGFDATDRPLPFGRREQSLADVEVVLSDRVAEISGTVVGDDGRPAPGALVIVMPIDRVLRFDSSRWLRRTTTGADGTFRSAGMPAGTYYVASVPRVPIDGEDAWQDPAFLESLAPVVTTVPVREGERRTITLRLATR